MTGSRDSQGRLDTGRIKHILTRRAVLGGDLHVIRAGLSGGIGDVLVATIGGRNAFGDERAERVEQTKMRVQRVAELAGAIPGGRGVEVNGLAGGRREGIHVARIPGGPDVAERDINRPQRLCRSQGVVAAQVEYRVSRGHERVEPYGRWAGDAKVIGSRCPAR